MSTSKGQGWMSYVPVENKQTNKQKQNKKTNKQTNSFF